jgi:hypothetical protein
MSLNKKQKKQIDAAKNKLIRLRQTLAGAKAQPDDPHEITRLQEEIAALEGQIRTIKEG